MNSPLFSTLIYLIFEIVTYLRDIFSVLNEPVSFHKNNKKSLFQKFNFYFNLYRAKFLKKINLIFHKKNTWNDLSSLSKKIKKIVLLIYLHVFLDLITNLWNPWELGLHFKNKKIILFVWISRITNLYVRRVPSIKRKMQKKYVLSLEWLSFNLIR